MKFKKKKERKACNDFGEFRQRIAEFNNRAGRERRPGGAGVS